MLRRLLAPALVVLGIVGIALAIASATLWRPADHLTIAAAGRADSSYLVSEPGVLDLAADDVTVTAASASGGRVVVAFARSADIDAWLGASPTTRVTGVARVDRDVVATTELRGSPTAETGPDPTGSDLWWWDRSGDGDVSFEWSRQDGRYGVLVWSAAGGEDVTLTLSWPQAVRTPWLVPGTAGGVLLVLVGAALWLLRARRARAERDRQAAVEATAELAAVSDAPLTRRQLREAQAGAEGRVATGPVPAVPEGRGPSEVPDRVPDLAVSPGTVGDGASEPTQPGRGPTRRDLRLAAARMATPDASRAVSEATAAAPSETIPDVTPASTPEAPGGPGSITIGADPVTPQAGPVLDPGSGAQSAPARARSGPRGMLGRFRRPGVAPEPDPVPPVEVWHPDPPTSNASADAWRKAWGFPGTTPEAATTEPATTEPATTEPATTQEEGR